MKAIADIDISNYTHNLPKINGELRLSEPMCLHTSFRIGGPADIFAIAADQSDIRVLLHWAREEGVPVFVLGAGTNILVSDKGIRGLVIRMGGELTEYRIGDTVVEAGSAVKIYRLIRETLDAGLTGLECLTGIPGTIGGAVCMNAGTWVGCIENIFESATVINSNAAISEIHADDMEFRYRGSIVKDGGFMVLNTVFRLHRGNTSEAETVVQSLLEKRKVAQPSGRTAGSVFKNPEGDYAGRLLEQAGAKGLQIGGACVSNIHANFIENIGYASADDVRRLVKLLQLKVEDKFGVKLEPEIQLVGDWI